jgi:hypothetical protein
VTDKPVLLYKVTPFSWIILVVLTAFSLLCLPVDITVGVVIGGLLVTVNLLLFHRVLSRALAPGSDVTPKKVLTKYYLRFLVTVLIIFILVSQHLVNGLGLILGLSTFFLTIVTVLFSEMGTVIYRKIIKEAV